MAGKLARGGNDGLPDNVAVREAERRLAKLWRRLVVLCNGDEERAAKEWLAAMEEDVD